MRTRFGQSRVTIAQVKSRLVAHEHVDRLWIAGRQIPEVAAVPLQTHSGQVREVRLPAHDAERPVEVVPFVFDLFGYHRTLPAQRPHPPQFGVRSKARLIHEPHLHPAPSLDSKPFKLSGQCAFEDFRRVGIFAGVTGPRHPQRLSSIFLTTARHSRKAAPPRAPL